MFAHVLPACLRYFDGGTKLGTMSNIFYSLPSNLRKKGCLTVWVKEFVHCACCVFCKIDQPTHCAMACHACGPWINKLCMVVSNHFSKYWRIFVWRLTDLEVISVRRGTDRPLGWLTRNGNTNNDTGHTYLKRNN